LRIAQELSVIHGFAEKVNVSLIGMMGSGKTTVGKLLAKKTGMDFIDVDLMIEEERKMEIADIFRELGQEKFREFEREAVQRLMQKDNAVISTGGGLAACEENMLNLKKIGPVVWLYASPEETLRRVKGTDKRPLLDAEEPEKKVEALLKARERHYGKAGVKVDTTGKEPGEIAEEILTFLGEYAHGGCKP
jgi:shikimate kinase